MSEQDETAALATHRVRYLLGGCPIYEDDVLVGFIDEPRWAWDDLTSAQQAKVRQEALRCQTRGATWEEVFPFVLDDYGIACPHKWENREPTFRECQWCRGMEPLPGRVVKVGDDWRRVPDPPPPRLRLPRKPDVLSDVVIDEYQWTGDHYAPAVRPSPASSRSHATLSSDLS